MRRMLAFANESPGLLGQPEKQWAQPGPLNGQWKGGASKDRRKYLREWRAKNGEHARNHRYKAKFGISLETYERMFLEQKGLCAICNKAMKRLCVDHCHNTKQMRGLLCHKCNMALGGFNDSVELLKAAIKYLNKEVNKGASKKQSAIQVPK